MNWAMQAVPGIGSVFARGVADPGIASASSDPNDDPMARLFGSFGGGGGGPVVVHVDPRQLGGLLNGLGLRAEVVGPSAPSHRPEAAGTPESLSVLRHVALVRSPLLRTPDAAESEAFGDILDLNVRRTAEFQAIAELRSEYARNARFSSAAETARLLAWFLAREADVQMGFANPEHAVGLLEDARVFLNLSRQSKSEPAQSQRLERVREVWVKREEAWTQVAQGIRLARTELGRAEALSDHDPEAAAQIALASGRRLLNIAQRLQIWGYPLFVHHVLHYRTEEAFETAVALFDRLKIRDKASQARGFLDEAKALHEAAHDAMYRASAWIPHSAEDRLTVLRPNSIMIRDTAVPLAAALGLPPLDTEEILESLRDRNRIEPVENAVGELASLQGTLDGIRGTEVPSTANLFSGLLFVGLGLEGAWGRLTGTLGTDIPPYVRALFGGYLAALGRVHEEWEGRIGPRDKSEQGLWRVARRLLGNLNAGLDSGAKPKTPSSGEVEEELEATRTLMDADQLNVAHDFILRLERNLEAAHRSKAPVKALHEVLDRRMATQAREALSAQGGTLPPGLAALFEGGRVFHEGEAAPEAANDQPGLLASLGALLRGRRSR